MQPRTLKLSFLLLLIALTLVSTARAALEIIEDAIEVAPRQIEWPTYDQGRLVVRPCPGCAVVALTVNEQTDYYLGFSNSELSRQELISKANNSGNSENTLVYVFYRAENQQVTRVVLDLGPR
jgi:hypothetical protein